MVMDWVGETQEPHSLGLNGLSIWNELLASSLQVICIISLRNYAATDGSFAIKQIENTNNVFEDKICLVNKNRSKRYLTFLCRIE